MLVAQQADHRAVNGPLLLALKLPDRRPQVKAGGVSECPTCCRDIKPENFLLSDKSADAMLKLCDFGLSAYW